MNEIRKAEIARAPDIEEKLPLLTTGIGHRVLDSSSTY
jgi:hypothetical protein